MYRNQERGDKIRKEKKIRTKGRERSELKPGFD